MTDIVIATNSGETSTLPEAPEAKAKQLPEPSGYHMLVCIPESEDKYDSGLVKADQTKHFEEVLSTVFFVIKLGPDCYRDATRFPSGPWCKEGDFVLARPNSGTRLKIHGREFRLLNDDSIEAVVSDPRGISRA
jgi:co-chaperonin GroES (HSP10)|tara:strand:+ start:267 stop:668 length:402 start_codon:yes stop_codon:yes gene_type:complete